MTLIKIKKPIYFHFLFYFTYYSIEIKKQTNKFLSRKNKTNPKVTMTTTRYFIPDFVEIQRQSFYHFLDKGIQEEFQKRNPITNTKKDIEIFFYPEYYKLSHPDYSIEKTIIQNKSFSSRLYIPVQLTDKRRKRIYLKWILIANLPLMTKRGHFIMNGSARVIVNQIVRGTGVYFQEKNHPVYTHRYQEKSVLNFKRYYCDFIPLRGTWLRLQVDKRNNVWVKLKRVPAFPLIWFLSAFGYNPKTLFNTISFSPRLLDIFKKDQEKYKKALESVTKKKTKIEKDLEFLKEKLENENLSQQVRNETKTLIDNEIEKLTKIEKMNKTKLKRSYPDITSTAEAWEQLAIFLNLRKNSKIKNNKELGRKWIFKNFLNPRTYQIGEQGRLTLNRKLGLSLSNSQITLTPLDLIAAVNYLFKLEKGLCLIDDIDHLKNRRVRSSGELIQAQFGIGLLRLEKIIRSKINQKFMHLNYLIDTKAVNGALREFFGSHPLSQFMDQINPLSEITHKRRLSSLGPGGVSRDAATLAIRGIHPSHYGRICPIETPEGKNTGLVNSLTTYARVNLKGFIETPFYKVYKGQVQKKLGYVYLTADQEEKTIVAAADVFVSTFGLIPEKNIPVRIGKNFTTISRNQIQYIGVSSIQMISVATSLIPFLEHDDANRALMGSNMQRQAVPIVRPERPLVGTGLEARVVSDSGHALTAKNSGFVAYVSAYKILMYEF
jgi:DNA-directed RNA polymerase subunit beta